MNLTLQQLADLVGGTAQGDAAKVLTGAAQTQRIRCTGRGEA